jgi:type I restriction enzyme S subunit
MARRVYEEWFVRFRFPGHEGVRMVESELGLVPEGWRLLRLGELVEFQKGKKPAAVFSEWAPGRAPALLIDALRGGSIEFAGANRLISVTRSDTIMVMDGSGSAQVFIGHEGVIGSTLGRYRVSKGASIGAFWLFLLFLTRQSDIGGKNIGAAIPHANKDYIRSMPVPAPPAQVAARFEQVVEPMFDLIQNLKAKISTLRATRDLLLPKLISGELDVSARPEPEALAA